MSDLFIVLQYKSIYRKCIMKKVNKICRFANYAQNPILLSITICKFAKSNTTRQLEVG